MGWSFVSRVSDVVKDEREETILDKLNENKVVPSSYGCEIILEKTTIENAKDSSFPNDAYLIWYTVGKKEHIDLVRGTRVRIFDMYYDKYGPGAIKKIDFGYGRTNPKLWGYKQPEKKKKR
jgi:hypothetical protein